MIGNKSALTSTRHPSLEYLGDVTDLNYNAHAKPGSEAGRSGTAQSTAAKPTQRNVVQTPKPKTKSNSRASTVVEERANVSAEYEPSP